MNMISEIENEAKTGTHLFGVLLSEARHRRGYSLDDVAETSGLTVDEVAALESCEDTDQARTARAAAAVGLSDEDLKSV
jgi:transcriptional regulator with XRE-family HTH domain